MNFVTKLRWWWLGGGLIFNVASFAAASCNLKEAPLTRLGLFVASLVVSFVVLANGAAAAPSCSLASPPEQYRLELTVPATFCQFANSATNPDCTQFPKPSPIQLHGLWPDYRQGPHPEGRCSAADCPERRKESGKFCDYPAPPGLYASADWRALSPLMASTGSCLERHEWVKHGLCTNMSAPAYFGWSLRETQRIVKGLSLPVNVSVSRALVNQRIAEHLPDLDGALRFSCRKNLLLNIAVLYAWGDTPGAPLKTKGGNNGFGNCPNQFVVPDKLTSSDGDFSR